MPTSTQPQSPLAVERIEPAFDELPDELDVQCSHDSDWLTIFYRGESVARYLPVREIAELDLHLVVDESVNSESEPDEVTDRLIKTLATVKDHGFKICHEYTEDFGNGCFRQSLVLRNRPVTEEDILELVPMALEASQYAIDKAMDEKTAQLGSD